MEYHQSGVSLSGVKNALFSRCFSELKAHREHGEGTKRHAQNLVGLPDHDTDVSQATWETSETFWGRRVPLVVQRGRAVASVSVPAGCLEEASVPI